MTHRTKFYPTQNYNRIYDLLETAFERRSFHLVLGERGLGRTRSAMEFQNDYAEEVALVRTQYAKGAMLKHMICKEVIPNFKEKYFPYKEFLYDQAILEYLNQVECPIKLVVIDDFNFTQWMNIIQLVKELNERVGFILIGLPDQYQFQAVRDKNFLPGFARRVQAPGTIWLNSPSKAEVKAILARHDMEYTSEFIGVKTFTSLFQKIKNLKGVIV